VWALGQDGRTWWPVKGKGVSIRLREILAVARALAEALRLTGGGPSRPALASPPPPARKNPRPSGPRADRLPLADADEPPARFRPGFDEFSSEAT
jgi:hypothetical protein